jgi:hypothetical protein
VPQGTDGSACPGHTFATLALIIGANPSYIARQFGHTNANMLK